MADELVTRFMKQMTAPSQVTGDASSGEGNDKVIENESQTLRLPYNWQGLDEEFELNKFLPDEFGISHSYESTQTITVAPSPQSSNDRLYFDLRTISEGWDEADLNSCVISIPQKITCDKAGTWEFLNGHIFNQWLNQVWMSFGVNDTIQLNMSGDPQNRYGQVVKNLRQANRWGITQQKVWSASVDGIFSNFQTIGEACGDSGDYKSIQLLGDGVGTFYKNKWQITFANDGDSINIVHKIPFSEFWPISNQREVMNSRMGFQIKIFENKKFWEYMRAVPRVSAGSALPRGALTFETDFKNAVLTIEAKTFRKDIRDSFIENMKQPQLMMFHSWREVVHNFADFYTVNTMKQLEFDENFAYFNQLNQGNPEEILIYAQSKLAKIPVDLPLYISEWETHVSARDNDGERVDMYWWNDQNFPSDYDIQTKMELQIKKMSDDNIWGRNYAEASYGICDTNVIAMNSSGWAVSQHNHIRLPTMPDGLPSRNERVSLFPTNFKLHILPQASPDVGNYSRYVNDAAEVSHVQYRSQIIIVILNENGYYSFKTNPYDSGLVYSMWTGSRYLSSEYDPDFNQKLKIGFPNNIINA